MSQSGEIVIMTARHLIAPLLGTTIKRASARATNRQTSDNRQPHLATPSPIIKNCVDTSLRLFKYNRNLF